MASVILYRSYDWECPNPECQRQNFAMGVGDFQAAPESVRCRHCGHEYETDVGHIPPMPKPKNTKH
jgi:rubredoxin